MVVEVGMCNCEEVEKQRAQVLIGFMQAFCKMMGIEVRVREGEEGTEKRVK